MTVTTLARRSWAGWGRWWFAPATAENLGLCRILFFIVVLITTREQRWVDWAEVPDLFWHPFRPTRELGLERLDRESLLALSLVFRSALVMGALGLLTRVSATAAFLSGTALFWLPHNFGKVHHGDAPLIFGLLILAWARSGDAFSLDAWWRRRRGRPAPPSPHGEYRWPLRLMQVLTLLIFFGAGVSKLRESGWDWAFSDAFSHLLMRHQVSHDPPLDWGIFIAERPPLARGMALIALLVELAVPLALFHRAFARAIVPSLGLMQIGNWLLLGIAFKTFSALYLFFIPWDRVLAWLRAAPERLRRRRTKG